MDELFKLGKSFYIIIVVILILGIALQAIRSEFLMLSSGTKSATIDTKEVVNTMAVDQQVHLEKDNFLLIIDRDDPSSLKLASNIETTISYMKKSADSHPVESIPDYLNNYNAIIITFEKLGEITDFKKLEQYVAKGGKVFFAVRPALDEGLNKIYRKLGIYEAGVFTITKGMEFTTTILRSEEKLNITDDSITNSSISVGLENSVETLAISNEGIPLLWKAPYHAGHFMIFNGTTLSSKLNRGVLVGAIAALHDDFLYPILNMKISFIDDFPSVIPKGYHDKLTSEYNLDQSSFFDKIWWPSIINTSRKYDVKYTGVFIQTFDDTVEAPFLQSSSTDVDIFRKYGRELLKMDGEISIKGYNNQPYSETIIPSSLPWKNSSDFIQSLQISEALLKEMFPYHTVTTYNPPSNSINNEGLKLVKEAIPSIGTVSSTYLANENANFVQEFEVDDHTVHLPKISSGYGMNDDTKWFIANGVSSIGVVSHTISPYEVLTSTKSWNELLTSYENLHHEIESKYPWLRSMTANEASQILKEYENTDIYTSTHSWGIDVKISRIKGPVYFILVTNKKIEHSTDFELIRVDQESYLVVAKNNHFKLRWAD